MSIRDYCRRLESMAASLGEFGDPIGDRQMVLALLRGHNGKFRHMVSNLKMHRPFPTFAEARTHLQLEEIDLDAALPSPPAAMVATPPPRPTGPTGPQPSRPAGLLRQIIAALQQEFSMTDMGQLHHFLRVSVTRGADTLFLSQWQYTLDILERAGMSACKPSSTPVDSHSKLSGDGPPVDDPTHYRSLASALQYLTFTRLDIAFAVQQICPYIHDPKEPHLAALKRILRYLQGTLSHGLTLHRSPPEELVVYSDADWAGCPDTQRSTSGYAVFLGDNLVSWSSKHQPTVSHSSAEAEYRAVANGVAEASWLRQLLDELCHPLHRATLVYCDNISVVYLSNNPVQHQRTKHIEIDLHFVRDRVALGQVRILHVLTTS
ncbi:uncharacterized mitochondrial protein AtMg00810-like [Miscanthus floridulus]|uniref:uncharacterized mitochondrial protein AtMg00810-like n=1 Tax=Miscanthus floridulus TaxID=154761 RepID=UPI0034573DAD